MAVAALVNKASVDRAAWDARALAAGSTSGWERFADEALVPHRGPAAVAQPPAGLLAFAARESAADAAAASTFDDAGRRFHAGALPLLDAGNGRIGRLVVARDTTPFRDDARRVSLAVAGVAVATAFTSGLLTFVSVRRLQRRLAGTQAQLVHDAGHDPLTGLPNRRKFLDHLDAVIRHSAQQKARAFALLFVDFDRFKLVNDSAGHDVGDELLGAVGARLRKALSLTGAAGVCTACRLGGDEFVVLIDPLADPADATAVADRVARTLAEPFVIKGHDIRSTVSIGITTSALSTGTADEVLRDADAAMCTRRGRRARLLPDRRRVDARETGNRLARPRPRAAASAAASCRLFH